MTDLAEAVAHEDGVCRPATQRLEGYVEDAWVGPSHADVVGQDDGVGRQQEGMALEVESGQHRFRVRDDADRA